MIQGIICRPEKYDAAVKLLQNAGLLYEPAALKPCPFCGGEAYRSSSRINGEAYVHCKNCRCGTGGCESAMLAEQLWNQRKESK